MTYLTHATNNYVRAHNDMNIISYFSSEAASWNRLIDSLDKECYHLRAGFIYTESGGNKINVWACIR